MKWKFTLVYLISLGALAGQADSALLDQIATYPPMPLEPVELVPFTGPGLTFGSGTPFNDLVYTLYDTDYMEGETSGYDHFFPVDPADPFPGTDQVKLIHCVSNVDLDATYQAAQGDRIILGPATSDQPFFLRGPNGIDDEWVVIAHFNYQDGHIQLKGSPEDYALQWATAAEGAQTDGYYLFYLSDEIPDLIAFIYPCDELVPPGGRPIQNPEWLCNDDGVLSLDNPQQFVFDQADMVPPLFDFVLPQVGGAGNDLVGGVTADPAGNVYLFGGTDSNLDGGLDRDNEFFVTKLAANGEERWTVELGGTDGDLIFDAVCDGTYLWLAGRTLGTLPTYQNEGLWDAVLLKLDALTGAVLATDQYGSAGIDGYGNITLDDAGHLYLSGVGSAEGANHLLAKHDAQTLANIWRITEPPEAEPVFVSEAWGGITYVPGATPGAGRVVISGWYMTLGGADSFVSVYDQLDDTTAQRLYTTTLASPGSRADWSLDNAVDSEGNIYLAGFTTGNLGGLHQGDGDMFLARFSPDLTNPTFVQHGTPYSDMWRKLEIDGEDRLFATGYTYGDFFAGTNADSSYRSGDVAIAQFNTELQIVQSNQIGTVKEDRAFSFLRDSVLVLAGTTEGSLTAANQGAFDAYALWLNSGDLAVIDPTGGVSTTTTASTRASFSWSVFPNPTTGELHLQLLDNEFITAELSVFDTQGRLIMREDIKLENTSLNLTDLAHGVYWLQLTIAGQSSTVRILKQP